MKDDQQKHSNQSNEEKLEKLFLDGRLDLPDLPDWEHINEQLDQYLLVDPPEDLTLNRRFSSNRIVRLSNTRMRFFAIAASVALLLAAGFLVGRYLQGEPSSSLANAKEDGVIQLIQNDFASDRLKAVSMATEIDEVSKKVTDVLIQTLNSDDHVNVRIACIDALIPMAENAYVRTALIQSISNQESPIVIMHLAEALSSIGESEAVGELDEYLDKSILNLSQKTF